MVCWWLRPSMYINQPDLRMENTTTFGQKAPTSPKIGPNTTCPPQKTLQKTHALVKPFNLALVLQYKLLQVTLVCDVLKGQLRGGPSTSTAAAALAHVGRAGGELLTGWKPKKRTVKVPRLEPHEPWKNDKLSISISYLYHFIFLREKNVNTNWWLSCWNNWMAHMYTVVLWRQGQKDARFDGHMAFLRFLWLGLAEKPAGNRTTIGIVPFKMMLFRVRDVSSITDQKKFLKKIAANSDHADLHFDQELCFWSEKKTVYLNLVNQHHLKIVYLINDHLKNHPSKWSKLIDSPRRRSLPPRRTPSSSRNLLTTTSRWSKCKKNISKSRIMFFVCIKKH